MKINDAQLQELLLALAEESVFAFVDDELYDIDYDVDTDTPSSSCVYFVSRNTDGIFPLDKATNGEITDYGLRLTLDDEKYHIGFLSLQNVKNIFTKLKI